MAALGAEARSCHAEVCHGARHGGLESSLHCRGVEAESLTLPGWSIRWGSECLVTAAECTIN